MLDTLFEFYFECIVYATSWNDDLGEKKNPKKLIRNFFYVCDM